MGLQTGVPADAQRESWSAVDGVGRRAQALSDTVYDEPAVDQFCAKARVCASGAMPVGVCSVVGAGGPPRDL
eukprot:7891876-Lingulodinium_polyedra.AAC.1